MTAAASPRFSRLRGVLFDVDGTLYDQRPLRMRMAMEWAAFAAGHPPSAVEVARSIVAFRRTREELRRLGRPASRLEDLQYVEAARRVGTDEARMRVVVQEWILDRPLRHLRRCRRPGVEELFRSLRARGLAVGVVSDYPGASKLDALGLAEHVSVTVCATDDAVNAFKPHPAGLAHACEAWSLAPEDVLYVGDRADVDAASAAALGMPCVIVAHRGGTSRNAGEPPFHGCSLDELRIAFGG